MATVATRAHDALDRLTRIGEDLRQFGAIAVTLAARLSPGRLVEVLGRVFQTCDSLADRHGLETIKTAGDCYLAVAGAPVAVDDHARRAADMALELVPAITAATAAIDCPVSVRVGIHSGEVVAGVIGDRRFAYDLWGPAVNLASRMESHGVAGGIQVSDATRALLGDGYRFRPRGTIDLKGIGPTEAWLLVGVRDGADRRAPAASVVSSAPAVGPVPSVVP